MPSSATLRMASGSLNSFNPNGPDQQPGGQVTQHRAQAQPLEQGHGGDAGGQQDDHRPQRHAMRLSGHGCRLLPYA